VDAIFFVHGESDGLYKTPLETYLDQMQTYFGMIGADNIYISTPGYFTRQENIYFDALRYAIKYQAEISGWTIAFDDAHTFLSRNMLVDEVHFNDEACIEVISAFIVATL
jgi:hypothetical protein